MTEVSEKYPDHPFSRIVEAYNRFEIERPGTTFLEFYEELHQRRLEALSRGEV